MSIRRLSNPTGPQLEAAAAVLSSAFSTDPASLYLTNGGDPAIARLHYLKTVTTAALDGELWVAELGSSRSEELIDNTQSIAAVMCIYPPGLTYGETPNSNGPHRDAANAAYPPGGQEFFSTLQGVLHNLELEAYGPEKTTPTYYVSHLGTKKTAQGLGLAGLLMKSIVDRGIKDKKKVTLITQTEQNVMYYGRFGFTVRSDTEAFVGGFPSHWWTMCMDPCVQIDPPTDLANQENE